MPLRKFILHIAVKIRKCFLYEQIGIHVGNDHATVHHHIKSFEFILKSDPILEEI